MGLQTLVFLKIRYLILETSGEPLGYTSDQITEHMHSFIDKTFRKSGYWIADPTSELCAKKQHEGILQINGFSVNIK